MPEPTITLTTPTSGSRVGLTINVSGTFTPLTPAPTITVVLKDANGNVVGTAMNIVAANGSWAGTITVTQGLTGGSVVASLPGGMPAIATNITVE